MPQLLSDISFIIVFAAFINTTILKYKENIHKTIENSISFKIAVRSESVKVICRLSILSTVDFCECKEFTCRFVLEYFL